jgi:hypothetical protein
MSLSLYGIIVLVGTSLAPGVAFAYAGSLFRVNFETNP